MSSKLSVIPLHVSGSLSLNLLPCFLGRPLPEYSGGEGNDLFVYTSFRDRGDMINDFEVGQDKIVLTQLLNSLVSGGYKGTDAIADGYVKIVPSTEVNKFGVQIDSDGASGRDIFRPFIAVNVAGSGNLNDAKNFTF